MAEGLQAVRVSPGRQDRDNKGTIREVLRRLWVGAGHSPQFPDSAFTDSHWSIRLDSRKEQGSFDISCLKLMRVENLGSDKAGPWTDQGGRHDWLMGLVIRGGWKDTDDLMAGTSFLNQGMG